MDHFKTCIICAFYSHIIQKCVSAARPLDLYQTEFCILADGNFCLDRSKTLRAFFRCIIHNDRQLGILLQDHPDRIDLSCNVVVFFALILLYRKLSSLIFVFKGHPYRVISDLYPCRNGKNTHGNPRRLYQLVHIISAAGLHIFQKLLLGKAFLDPCRNLNSGNGPAADADALERSLIHMKPVKCRRRQCIYIQIHSLTPSRSAYRTLHFQTDQIIHLNGVLQRKLFGNIFRKTADDQRLCLFL